MKLLLSATLILASMQSFAAEPFHNSICGKINQVSAFDNVSSVQLQNATLPFWLNSYTAAALAVSAKAASAEVCLKDYYQVGEHYFAKEISTN